MARRRRPRPLHRRLAVIVAAILLATLGLSGVATYLAFASYLQEQLDTTLRDTPLFREEADQACKAAAAASNTGNGSTAANTSGWDFDARPRVTPFMQINSADGTVLRFQAGHDAAGRTYSADLPSPLPQVARSDATGGQRSSSTLAPASRQGLRYG
jgi:two-component system, OmpR family, sensor kinase